MDTSQCGVPRAIVYFTQCVSTLLLVSGFFIQIGFVQFKNIIIITLNLH